MIKWSLNIVFVAIALGLFGQQVNTSIDKDQIKIGASFTLTLSVVSNTQLDHLKYEEYTHQFPAKSSSNKTKNGINTAYELDILSAFKDTLYKENDQYIWKGTYQLTGWDSAYVVIPPQKIYIDDSLHYSSARLIHVTSPTTNPGKPIYDINEAFTQVTDQNSKIVVFLKKNWWWLIIILVGLFLLIVYLRKYFKKEAAPLSLRKSTLKKINQLEQSKGYEENLKEYYFDLSIILRRFFAAHYQTPIMDKTTSEIEQVLMLHKLDKEMILLARQLLNQSDMVKFAQMRPKTEEVMRITNKARRVVNEVADLDLEDE